MLRENWRFIARVEQVADTAIVIFSFFFAYYGRGSLLHWNRELGLGLPFEGEALSPIIDYLIVLFIGLPAYLTSLRASGAYTSMRMSSLWHLVSIIAVSSSVAFVSLATALFLLKLDLSRSFIALFCILASLLLLVERYGVLKFLRYWRLRGRNYRKMLVCGIGPQAMKLISSITSCPELGIGIGAVADLRDGSDEKSVGERSRFLNKLAGFSTNSSPKLLCGVEDVAQELTISPVDEVVFTDIAAVMNQVEMLVDVCSQQGIRTTIAADLFSLGMVSSHVSYFGGMPLIHFQTPPGDRWELSVKRLLDVVISAILLIGLSPLFFLAGAGILITSGRPVLFKQKRVGLNGRLFSMYKFRSMERDAELKRHALEQQNEMSGPVFKVVKDPRITPIGAILRRYSVDELPQLWNVFRGDMSLVGPRPPIPGEVSLYQLRDRRRLSMRPGLTCTWQVSGRNEIADFESWVKLDLEYIDNWSLSRDVSLLVKTIPAVLFGTGAR